MGIGYKQVLDIIQIDIRNKETANSLFISNLCTKYW